MSDADSIVKVLVGLVGLWMLYDLTFGWSSPRQQRERDRRWNERLNDGGEPKSRVCKCQHRRDAHCGEQGECMDFIAGEADLPCGCREFDARPVTVSDDRALADPRETKD